MTSRRLAMLLMTLDATADMVAGGLAAQIAIGAISPMWVAVVVVCLVPVSGRGLAL